MRHGFTVADTVADQQHWAGAIELRSGSGVDPLDRGGGFLDRAGAGIAAGTATQRSGVAS
jgi:hypothetical protein